MVFIADKHPIIRVISSIESWNHKFKSPQKYQSPKLAMQCTNTDKAQKCPSINTLHAKALLPRSILNSILS
jgi:hypothetical protein